MSQSKASLHSIMLFELHGADGHIWKLYEDGLIEGFPPGAVILNRAQPLLAMLRERVVNLERARVTNKKAEMFGSDYRPVLLPLSIAITCYTCNAMGELYFPKISWSCGCPNKSSVNANLRRGYVRVFGFDPLQVRVEVIGCDDVSVIRVPKPG